MRLAMRIFPLAAAATAATLTLGTLGAAAVTWRQPAPATAAGDTYRNIEALSYVFGSKRAVGYFRGVSGKCHLTLMIAEATDPDIATPPSAARLSLSMAPGQNADLMSVEGESVHLTCGPNADTVQVRRASLAGS
jgi:hypothetical protein